MLPFDPVIKCICICMYMYAYVSVNICTSVAVVECVFVGEYKRWRYFKMSTIYVCIYIHTCMIICIYTSFSVVK